jgi:hypothetical protein
LSRSTSLSVPLYVLPVVIGTKNTRLTGTSDGTQPNQDPENFGPPNLKALGGAAPPASHLFVWTMSLPLLQTAINCRESTHFRTWKTPTCSQALIYLRINDLRRSCL